MNTLDDLQADRIDGTPLALSELKGRVLLIVNTASAITWSSVPSRMPRTPSEARPANTRSTSSLAWKRMARPVRVASSTSSPSRQVAKASTRRSLPM